MFGKLTVLKQTEDHVEVSGRRRARWDCLCECGNHTYVTSNDLRKGNTNSCGCSRWEFFRESAKKGNQYIDYGDYYTGFDAKGETFLIDKEDYEKVSEITWNVEIRKDGYKRVSGHLPRGKRILLHQYLMSDFLQIDHADRDGTNNRRCNLREATPLENSRNKGLASSNKSGVIGVNTRNGKWYAHITVEGNELWLGTHVDKTDAVRERLLAEHQYFGEFAPQKHLYEKYGIEVESLTN